MTAIGKPSITWHFQFAPVKINIEDEDDAQGKPKN
jgi:hypothetical protein